MRCLPEPCKPILVKLIPRLASNHDGEVVATARAIERVSRLTVVIGMISPAQSRYCRSHKRKQ
jgi:hypothetical protein